MAKYDITQLEQAETVPAGSLHLIEMGDGSGTKAVTQEVLEEKIGEALKVGDLAQLQTEDKTNLVAAINEAAQSGGGGASVDILDTKEEIEANTEDGKAAGALAVQEMFGELIDNLQGFHPVIDPQTGKMTGYKTTVGGADTVFPFSSGANGGAYSARQFTIEIDTTGLDSLYYSVAYGAAHNSFTADGTTIPPDIETGDYSTTCLELLQQTAFKHTLNVKNRNKVKMVATANTPNAGYYVLVCWGSTPERLHNVIL